MAGDENGAAGGVPSGAGAPADGGVKNPTDGGGGDGSTCPEEGSAGTGVAAAGSEETPEGREAQQQDEAEPDEDVSARVRLWVAEGEWVGATLVGACDSPAGHLRFVLDDGAGTAADLDLRDERFDLVLPEPGENPVPLAPAPEDIDEGMPFCSSRVRVFWPDEGDWFVGHITGVAADGRTRVDYDDGDVEVIWLHDQRFELLPPEAEAPSKRSRSGARKPAGAGQGGPKPRSDDIDFSEPESLMSRRLRVWWPKMRKWYTGVIMDVKRERTYVIYDDGECSWLTLKQEVFRWITGYADQEDPFDENDPENGGAISDDERPKKRAKKSVVAKVAKLVAPAKEGGTPADEEEEEELPDEVEEIPRDPEEVAAAWKRVGLGRRIQVFWPAMDRYYEGAVHDVLPDGRIHIIYDDDDEDKVRLLEEKFQWVDGMRGVVNEGGHAAGDTSKPLLAVKDPGALLLSRRGEVPRLQLPISVASAPGDYEIVWEVIAGAAQEAGGCGVKDSTLKLEGDLATVRDYFKNEFGGLSMKNIDIFTAMCSGSKTELYDWRGTAVLSVHRQTLTMNSRASKRKQLAALTFRIVPLEASAEGQPPVQLVEIFFAAMDQPRGALLKVLVGTLEEQLTKAQVGECVLVVPVNERGVEALWREQGFSRLVGDEPPDCKRVFRCFKDTVLMRKWVHAAPPATAPAPGLEDGGGAFAMPSTSRYAYEHNVFAPVSASAAGFAYIPHCVGVGSGGDKPLSVPYPLEVFLIADDRGYGVRALTTIPPGVALCEYVGEVITRREAEDREVSGVHYKYDLLSGALLDATRIGNVARFVNHSCEPNLVSREVLRGSEGSKGHPRIFLTTSRQVEAGEEIAYNYHPGRVKIAHAVTRTVRCLCGAAKCTGWVF